MLRRDLLQCALALPSAGLWTRFHQLTAADRGKVSITDIKIKPISGVGHTLVRIDTDAGVSGYGESGVTGAMMKAWLERYKPLLIQQDPLAIQYHFFRMSTLMHTYMASAPALSGIDMALWDLAGKLRGEPVYKLLGGPFRDEVTIFINSEPRNMHDKGAVRAWADEFKAQGQGFRAVKVNTTGALGMRAGRYIPTLTAMELGKIGAAFQNIREALGPDYEIMAHCHNEFDLPTSKGIARMVEPIQPKWLEDPLPPPFSDSWVALKRECRVPLLTGEKLEMPNGFYPFLKEQAVDFIYPDIAFCGGITAIMKIANLAALYRIPVATHNVGGILLTMSSIHFGLSIHDFLTSEARMGGRQDILVMARNPPAIKGGMATKPEAPGLGVDLDDAGVKQWQREGDWADWISV
ncbi:MAG: mandelate racemase/muconate lactonizing enzyme family protein [Bryobacteraceae bacterium]|nr:mandelate racemase/muconate lactonizing enzyme family protein [Bryobacteraceae bacterium]